MGTQIPMSALIVQYLGIKIQTQTLTYFQNWLKSFVHELFIQVEPSYHGNFLSMVGGNPMRMCLVGFRVFFQLLGFKFFFTFIILVFPC